MTDLLRRADSFVGVPYQLHGEDPAGWDCLGLVRYLRRELFGRPTPPWGADYTRAHVAAPAEAARVIGTQLHRWRNLGWNRGGAPPPPGAVLLITRLAHASHVGLMLDLGHFIHAEPAAGTSIQPLAPRWETRIIGAYDAPADHA